MSDQFVVRIKDGVTFEATVGDYQGKIAPAGFALLCAIAMAARDIQHDLTITSGSDGCHSGQNDPHHRGEAYDVRTHDLPDAQAALAYIKAHLPDYDHCFYAFLEDPGTDNEHIHCQIKKDTTFPAVAGG